MYVICTDWGDDIDDAISVALAARTIDRFVVLTADESGDHRARGVSEQLRRHDRTDVPVIRGLEIGGGRGRRRSSMGLATRPCEHDPEMIEALTDLALSSSELRWVGQGPLSNVAAFAQARPDLAGRIRLTQMGFWLDRYRDTSRASHNPRMDPRAAGAAVRLLDTPRLVLSDHTEAAAIRITREHDLMRRLAAPDAPGWARLLVDGFEEWAAYRSTAADQSSGVGSWLHDPLTLSAGLDLGFVRFVGERIRVEADARAYRDPEGIEVEVSTGADHEAFMDWVMKILLED
ncbi:hypothetical protein NRB20_61290 [Nocardia sp. RB20]|uniref:Inosine/uridine-preferring nucleoside hydrolase domain-containing protein n=2 Tax=Nocardia macrotermitis TaxID=2585198 RepID=A0A7K0DDR7_9NOCA|nr:hypothetical protein [Nocardia macrotermitis]